MLGDDIIQTEKGKLNQRVCRALFKFLMYFKEHRSATACF